MKKAFCLFFINNHMDSYKDPDQCQATKDRLAFFSKEYESTDEEPFQAAVFTDPELS
jgi:hypothetical protein